MGYRCKTNLYHLERSLNLCIKKKTSNADRRHLSEAFDFYFSFSKMIDMRVGKERTIGCGVWSRVALLLTRGGATSIYTVGRTEKKNNKRTRGEKKKKKKKKKKK